MPPRSPRPSSPRRRHRRSLEPGPGSLPACSPGADGNMPGLDEALPLIRAAGIDPDGAAAARLDDLEPFAAMIAALRARQVTPAIWRPALEALGESGLL